MFQLFDRLSRFLSELGAKIQNLIIATDSKIISLICIVFFIAASLMLVFWLKNKRTSVDVTTDESKEEYEKSENEFNNTHTDSFRKTTAIQKFRKANLLVPTDFYLFPEAFKRLERMDWEAFFKICLSLIISDETLRRYFGEKIVYEPSDISKEVEGISLKIDKIELIPKQKTAIHLTIVNKAQDKPLNMTVNPKTVRDNEDFLLILDGEHDVKFEQASNPEMFKAAFLPANKKLSTVLYFRTLLRSDIKNLDMLELKFRLKHARTRKGNTTDFTLRLNVDGVAYPDIITEIKEKEKIDRDVAQLILSCGGMLIPAWVMSFFILVILGSFGFLTFLLGFGISITLLILGVNLNTKLHQIIQDTK